MASLTNNKIKETYQSLVKFNDNGNITTSAKRLTDGFGNNSPFFVSTTQIGIGVTPTAGFDLHVNTNAKIGGNLNVGGNLTVSGTLTYLDVEDLATEDPLIKLARNNTANTLDIGFFGKYIESSVTKYKGIFNDADDDKWKFFIGTSTEPTTVVDTAGTGYTKADIVIGAIDSTGGTFSGQITIPETPTADGHAASKKYVDDHQEVEVAKRLEIDVKNVFGATMTKGTVVHAQPTGTLSGNVIEVVKADANVAANMPAIAVLNEDLNDEAEGKAVMFGTVQGIDTSSFSVGDELYVSTTAGEFTATKPTATTDLVQKIAVVVKSHASNGLIKVFGAGRSNDVPNEVDRDLSIAGNLKVDDYIEIEADSGYGRLEIGGPDGGYIDLKTPFSDDYDLRITTNSSGSEFTGSGDFNLNAGNTLTLTLDGTTQDATFAGDVNISKSVGDAVLTIEADTDNNNENDNPRIELKQDAAQIYTHLGINGDADNTFTGAIANYGYLRSNLGLQVVTGATGLALTISNTQNVTFAGKIILPSSHTKQKIEVYGGGSEWIGTSTSTLELSGGSINLNGASGTGASTLKNAGTTIIDTSSNVYAYSFRPVGNTNGLHIYGYGGTHMMIQGVSGATYYRESGSNTLCSTHQSGYIILATGLAYGVVNNYTQIIDGSTGAITGTSATFSGNITPTTDSTSDLGSTSLRWANVWTDNINGGTPVNTANDLVFDRASTRKIIFHSDTNFGSDRAFLYFNENSSFHRTGTENVRFSIGTFNDFSNSSVHSDAVDLQGGSRLYLNAGDWDTELDSAIGTPATGAYLDDYPIQFAINNDQKIRIGSGGDLNVKSATYSNYLNIGTYTSNHINSSTLPDVPSEHMINIAPPSTTNYYGGGISWSEGTNTAASLGVFDDGGTGALGFYVATGNNSGLTKAFEIDSSQNAELYGPLRITTSNLDGVIEGYDSNHSIVLRENNTNSTSYYQYGGTLAQGRGHKFYTGGTKANQTLKFHIADDGATFSGTATYHKIQTFYDGDYTSGFKFSDYNGGIWYDAGNDDLYVNGNHANSQVILQSGGSTALTLDSSQNATFAGHVIPSADSTYDLGSTSSYWRNLYVDNIISDGGNSNALKVYRGSATISNTAYTTIATVNGDNLASAIRLAVTGTSGNVVINVVAEILVNHSTDILIKAQSGFYTRLKIKIVSDNNEDFAIELQRVDTAGNTTVEFEITPLGNEAITLTSSHSISGSTLEHTCERGESRSSNDTAGYKYDSRFEDGAKIRLGDSSDLQIYHDGSNSFIKDTGTGSLIIPSSTFAVTNAADTEYMARMVQDAQVELYYNGGKKFETTSGGISVTGTIDATGRVKVSGSNTDQYYFEGQRNGVGVTYRLYDNGNTVYHDSWSTQVFRLNQNGGSGGYLSITGGGVGINMPAISDGGQLYISNGQSALNQGHPATSGSTQNAITRVFAGYGTYGEVLDTGFNVSSSPYAWIQATNHTALNVNYNLILNPNGGSVGIGTGQTAPAEKLTVDGNILANVSNNGTIKAQYDSNNFSQLQANSSGGVFTADSGGTTKILLRSYGDAYFNGGDVGIGLTTGINQKLTVNGNISVPNTNSIYFAGPDDANWRIGRNIHTYINQYCSGSSLDIMAHHSSSQGFTIGPNTSGAYASLEILHGTTTNHAILLTGNVNMNGTGLLSNRKLRSGGGYSLEGGGYNTSYTPDGLWGGTATPNRLYAGTGQPLLLGYQDNGTGLYATAYGFETKSTDGLGNTVNKDVIILKNTNSGNWQFTVSNLGRVYSRGLMQVNNTSRTDEALNINGNIKGVNASAGYTHFFHNDPYHGMTLRGYPTSNTSTSMTAADVMSFMEYGGDFRFYKKSASVLTLQGRLSNGTWTVTDDIVAFGSPSDIRLKENIKPIKSALDKVDKLKGVTFDWKENEDDLTNIKHDYGFIAQDVEKVIPELVRTKEDGMKSLRYQGITPILLEAIKELKAEIQELKSEIKELKK